MMEDITGWQSVHFIANVVTLNIMISCLKLNQLNLWNIKCCITWFKKKILKFTLCSFNNNKMGLIVAFMLSHLSYRLSTRKILQVYLLMKIVLWDHLYDCYKQGRLITFPSAKENVKRNTAKSISFELICSWWMSWAKQNTWSVELQMTECDSCMEWFHQKYQQIPDQVFQETLERLCNACQQLSVRYLVILF